MLRAIVILALAIVFSCGHWAYALFGELRLFEWAGGIVHLPSGWTEYRGIDVAWAIPIRVPVTAILAFWRRPCVTSIFVCHDLRLIMEAIGINAILLGFSPPGLALLRAPRT